jgi:parallel beta-helix repeat protein
MADAIMLCGDTTQGCGPAQNIKVRNNHVVANRGNGIVLLSADSNLLKTNHVERNGTDLADMTDGIRIDVQSMQNQISENHMSYNVTHDCHDGSTGTGTAGTANFWVNDQGVTQNRPGLCR